MTKRPAYDELPDGRAIGLYGPGEQLGALNLLTPERTRAAAGLIRSGQVFSLNLPITEPSPHPATAVSRRRGPVHNVIRHARGRDEFINDFYPQYSSQWDGFLHVIDPEHQCFYNQHRNESIGIEVWAERGIAGRGVLLDVARWREAQGRPVDWQAREVISIEDLEGCAAAQGVVVEEGTILVIRFGWETGWYAADFATKSRIAAGAFASPGLEPHRRTVRRLWDWGVAAVASDNMALEPFPIDFEVAFMHVDLLTRAGIPIGEFFHVDALAEACAAEGRYEFFFTSAPLNLPGGVGSPPNALAIL